MSNILIFSPSYPPEKIGGIDKVVIEFCKLDYENFYKRTIVTFTKSSSTELSYFFCDKTYYKVIKIPVLSTDVKYIVSICFEQYFDKLCKLININEFDAIVNHDWFLGELAKFIGAKVSIPIFNFIHSFKYEEYLGNLTPYQIKIHEKQVDIVNYANITFCLSDNIKLSLISFVKEPESIKTLKCGMSKPKPYKVHNFQKCFTYYYHGRFSNEKNLLNLIQAFYLLDFDCKLILRGKGKLLPEMKALISNLNLLDKVQIRPWCSSSKIIQMELEQSHVFVMPSTYEPLGLSLLEAVTAGTPAVLTDKYGPMEVFQKIATGWLCSGNDISDISSALKKSYENWQYMVDKLNETKWKCFSHYSWDIGYKSYNSYLEDSLDVLLQEKQFVKFN